MKKKKCKKSKPCLANKTYCLLVYVENCSTRVKKFKSTKTMGKFISDFCKKNPGYASSDHDNWIDFAITDISGEIHFFTDSMKVE